MESSRRLRFHIDPEAVFFDGVDVQGISVVTDEALVQDMKFRLKQFVKGRNEFPVSWPVTLYGENINLLERHDTYIVKPKILGTRYLLYIDQLGDQYMENNSEQIFQIDEEHKIHFPSIDMSTLRDTVLDGVVARKVDCDGKEENPRLVFVIQDAIRCSGVPLSERGIEERLVCVQSGLMNLRRKALERKAIDVGREPFGIDLMPWREASKVEEFLTDEFSRNLDYEIVGFIFHPKGKPYRSGTQSDVLQWSFDPSVGFSFRLKIEPHGSRKGSEKGFLYVRVGYVQEKKFAHRGDYCTIEVDDEVRKWNNKVIACELVDGKWTFIFGRKDRLHPNGSGPAESKLKAMMDPVSKEDLLSFFER